MNEMQTFIGKIGETYALNYLKKQGLSIRAKNFHSAFGEIDIIAEDQKTLVFVEVKLRKSTDHGSPFDFISPWKQDKIRKTAEFYLLRHRLRNKPCRFDAIGIVGDVKGDEIDVVSIEWIRDAF